MEPSSLSLDRNDNKRIKDPDSLTEESHDIKNDSFVQEGLSATVPDDIANTTSDRDEKAAVKVARKVIEQEPIASSGTIYDVDNTHRGSFIEALEFSAAAKQVRQFNDKSDARDNISRNVGVKEVPLWKRQLFWSIFIVIAEELDLTPHSSAHDMFASIVASITSAGHNSSMGEKVKEGVISRDHSDAEHVASAEQHTQSSDFMDQKIRIATRGSRGKALPKGYKCQRTRQETDVNEAAVASCSNLDTEHVKQHTQSSEFMDQKIRIATRGSRGKALPKEYTCQRTRQETDVNEAAVASCSNLDTEHVKQHTQSTDFMDQKIRIATRGRRGKALPEGYTCERTRQETIVNEAAVMSCSQLDIEPVVPGKGCSHAGITDEAPMPGAVAVPGINHPGTSAAWDELCDDEVMELDLVETSDTEAKENNQDSSTTQALEDDENGVPNAVEQPMAILVDENEWEDRVRENMLHDAVRAEVVTVDESKEKYRKYAWVTFAIAMLAIAISIIAWLFSKDNNSKELTDVPSIVPSMSPTTTPLPTLQTITDRGELRCAVSGNYEIEHTICKAIAAAVLGDATKTKKVIVDASNPYVALSNKEADVATTFSKFSMDKDVYQKDTQVGFTFTSPWFYDGYAFGGEPEYLKCANNLDGYFGECNKLRICVHSDEAYDAVREWFQASIIKMVPYESFYQSFKDGKCNVLSGLSIEVSEAVLVKEVSTQKDYTIGELWLSRVATAAVTTEEDAVWSNFVEWVIRALFAAEQRNITRATADLFTTTNVFGEQYQNMFRNAIQAVGNYGTILKEDPLTSLIPRPLIQQQNNGVTGLIYSFPFGEHSNVVGPEPAEGSVMKNILNRGFIRCGVIIEEETIDWRVLGKEYCRALSAGLFHGNASRVEFINVNNTNNGYISLDKGEIDLLSGARVSLEADAKEPTTGKGFTFSLPYYYGDPQGESLQEGEFISGDSIGLVTREDDHPWSDFVFWMVPATFYAEEKGITKNMADEMPSIYLFGKSLEDMYRHAIGAVGNYDEMYKKKWEGMASIMERQGRNQLNRYPFGPQVKPMFSVK